MGRGSADADDSAALGDYIVMDCIGQGQFGVVYKALSRLHGNFVAVKKLALDKDKTGTLMTEIDLLKSLSHPNIVRYIQHVSTKTHMYIIMEYIENGSLRTLLRKCGNLPELLTCTYLEQVLFGLQYLHHQGVIHRDIKSANLLVSTDGTIKVTDFGVSTRYELTSKGASDVAGTPNWMAPEIIQMQPPTTACDIWSLGITIIELLTGNPPYFELPQQSAIYKIVMEDHPPLPLGISTALEDFLLKCFKKEENLRPSADQLLQHPWIQKLDHNKGTGDFVPSARPTRGEDTLMQRAVVSGGTVKFSLEDVEKSLMTIRLQRESDATSVLDQARAQSFSKNLEAQRACIEKQQQQVQPAPSKQPAALKDDDDIFAGLEDLDDLGDALVPKQPKQDAAPPASTSDTASTFDDGFATCAFEAPMKVQTCHNNDTLDPDCWDDDLFNTPEDTANEIKRQMAQQDIVRQLNTLDSTVDSAKNKLLTAQTQDIAILVQPSMAATSLQHMLRPYFPLLVLVQHLKRFVDAPSAEACKATTALLTVLCTAALNSTDCVSALCSLQAVSLVSKCTTPAFSSETRAQAILLLHSLSVSKNPVALDVLISRECLGDLCRVLDTALTSDSHSQELLLSNAVDCIWSVVGAQDQIAKVTCCVTMSDIGITPHMLNALSATIKAHDTLGADEHRTLCHGVDALLTLASVYSPPFRQSLCTPEAIAAFVTFLQVLKPHVCEELAPCVLNVMKVLHHASSEESNSKPLEAVMEWIIPYLGLTLDHSTAAEPAEPAAAAHTRKATPVEINNQILHILYNLCALDPERALKAAAHGLVPAIKRSLDEDWPMRELTLPVLFNLLRSPSAAAHTALWQAGMLPELLRLLGDQGWCVDACDCLARWLAADTAHHVQRDVLRPENVALLRRVLTAHRGALSFPKLLATYTSLAQSDRALAAALINEGVARDVLDAVAHERRPFTRVALLRLLRALYASTDAAQTSAAAAQETAAALQGVVAHDTSALVKSISKEIVSRIGALVASSA